MYNHVTDTRSRCAIHELRYNPSKYRACACVGRDTTRHVPILPFLGYLLFLCCIFCAAYNGLCTSLKPGMTVSNGTGFLLSYAQIHRKGRAGLLRRWGMRYSDRKCGHCARGPDAEQHNFGDKGIPSFEHQVFSPCLLPPLSLGAVLTWIRDSGRNVIHVPLLSANERGCVDACHKEVWEVSPLLERCKGQSMAAPARAVFFFFFLFSGTIFIPGQYNCYKTGPLLR
ncbi:hypothetical protein EDB85DRAFT_1932582 [Lactarius pseudohatsudake]|nr:hypothetical protein EDB85DRAFT_1932582 [Lactarius pseudohatsudake]